MFTISTIRNGFAAMEVFKALEPILQFVAVAVGVALTIATLLVKMEEWKIKRIEHKLKGYELEDEEREQRDN